MGADLGSKVSLERFGPISRSDQHATGGADARTLPWLGACLGLLSAPAAGSVDRARPTRHDVARPGATRPRSASPRPLQGVCANWPTWNAGVSTCVVLHLGDTHALCRSTFARHGPALPARPDPHTRRERALLAGVGALGAARVGSFDFRGCADRDRTLID